MASNRFVVGSVLLSFLSVACAHQGPEKTSLVNPSTGEVMKKAETEVPPELWSPERKKANASFYYLAGEYELMNRNAGGAAKLFETAYAMEPNAFVGSKLIESKSVTNFEEALTLAKKMSLLYPHNGDIQLSYGRLLAAKGEMKEAETYLRNAVRMRPESLESSVLLIQLLQAQNKTKEAIVVAKSMVEKNGDFVEGWALLARLHLVNNQPNNAVAPARKAFELNSTDPEKIHLLAVSLLLAKQTKPALTYFDTLIKPENFSDDSIEKMLTSTAQLKLWAPSRPAGVTSVQTTFSPLKYLLMMEGNWRFFS
ncbi:MAG: tetratricopeptide repeat protein [Proteobacteria bacterium]|nr:MAG: tetratricopeptide repeat protein [Pseudomonadota bacterium]